MDADVVIAGGGPVGSMLAAELGLHGVHTVVLERLAEPSDESRAQALHGRTIAVLDQRGLLETFRAAERTVNGGSGDSRGSRALPRPHFAGIPRPPRAPAGDGPPPVVFVPQQVTTRLLADRASGLGARFRRPCEVTGFSQDDDGVTVRTTAGTVRARYLVGCDGARSVVRRGAGIAFAGTDATLSTLAAEVRLADPGAVPPGWTRTRRGVTVFSPHPGDGMSRLVALDTDGPDPRDAPVARSELAALATRILGRDIEITEIGATQRYGDAARLAERYRAGRVFVTGDAAHIHYPVGGQGLNVGLQDAVNLGWKLAALVQGWAPDGLPDTYDAERRPVAAAVLAHARAQVALLGPDPRIDALRAMVAELVTLEQVDTYLADRVSAEDVRYPDPAAGHPLVGAFVPPCTVTTDHGPRRAAELLRAGRPVLLDLTARAELGERVAPWRGRVDVVAARGDRPDLGALLVRPDGYVAWAAPPDTDGTPDGEQLDGAVRRWFGDPTPPGRWDQKGSTTWLTPTGPARCSNCPT